MGFRAPDARRTEVKPDFKVDLNAAQKIAEEAARKAAREWEINRAREQMRWFNPEAAARSVAHLKARKGFDAAPLRAPDQGGAEKKGLRFVMKTAEDAYRMLHPYVRRPGPESEIPVLTPLDYHVSTSPLVQMLWRGHHGVKLAQKEMETVYTWIDLNYVGRADCNLWGLYDMHGNAAEWTLSDYAPYPYAEDDGRNAGGAERRKAVRGGSFASRPRDGTSACRLGYWPWQKVFDVGFRVALEAKEED